MDLTKLPTEKEIELKSIALFPENPIMRSSFVLGVWLTIYNMPYEEKI